MSRGLGVLLAAVLILASTFTYGAIPAAERAALIVFYNSTNGDNWTDNSGWKTAPLDADGFAMPGTEDDWLGVSVVSGGVYQLDLSNNNLVGTIPAEIQGLSQLKYLYLNGNSLTGMLPPELGNLSKLVYLWLSGNNIKGSFIPELGNLTQLSSLNLSSNSLGGTLPVELGNMTGLKSLQLGYNHISGSFPSTIGNLTQLTSLILSNNQFYGSIPTAFKNLVNLKFVYLDDNWFSGSIPAEIGEMTSLTFLYLGSNSFTGSIPPEMGNLANLMILEINNNYLSGSVPGELGNLDKLTVLNLKSNRLTGTIPVELANMDKIQKIYLSRNKLTGNIPEELTTLSTLQYFYLGANYLVGPVPTSVADLSSLYYIELSLNGFYNSDSALESFLEVKSPFWRTSQTVAPEDVAGTESSSTSVTLTWTPIEYTSQAGSYRVYAGTVPGGPYSLAAETADKTAASIGVSGLNPGTTYYFVIQTRTAASINNQNEVLSHYSDEISVKTQAGAVPVQDYQLTVHSSPAAGVTVTVSPNDTGGSGDGQTTFTRTYNKGTAVTLTAPAEYNGNVFSKWTVDGIDNSNATVQVTMNRNHSATAVYKEEDSPPPPPPPSTNSVLALSRGRLNFGYDMAGVCTPAETLRVIVSGSAVDWSASVDAPWLALSQTSGTGTADVSVSVNPAGLSAGQYRGVITVSAPDAEDSPRTANVTLTVYSANSATEPSGDFSTPIDGATVYSSVPVTGWVVDDIGIDCVKIYRQGSSPKDLLYVGDAVFVEGARPDVEELFPDYPGNYAAGWGYMLLTNFFPEGGNGTFILHAIATDVEGNSVTLGTKTITCDNANAVKPFGAIDTPTQGGIASGSSFLNWGWVLTPQPNSIPTDGSTIDVYVDGVKLGHLNYNIYREDIATFFPGYANSDGAIGYYILDTTLYEDGIHSIMWIAKDSAGNTDGIGSRYFTIDNSGLERSGVSDQCSVFSGQSSVGVQFIEPAIGAIGDRPEISIDTRELEPLEIHLEGRIVGYSKLPVGSTLDSENGKLYWSPGVGFVGKYMFIFVEETPDGRQCRKRVHITIHPRFEVN